jgi:hypothetical protein
MNKIAVVNQFKKLPQYNVFLNNTWFHPTSMRFLGRTKIPADAGNKMVQDPNFPKNLEEYMNKVKPEAAYFLPLDER